MESYRLYTIINQSCYKDCLWFVNAVGISAVGHLHVVVRSCLCEEALVAVVCGGVVGDAVEHGAELGMALLADGFEGRGL